MATQWLGRATNGGPLADGSSPTGRPLTVPGASFFQVEGDKIRALVKSIMTGRRWMSNWGSKRPRLERRPLDRLKKKAKRARSPETLLAGLLCNH